MSAIIIFNLEKAGPYRARRGAGISIFGRLFTCFAMFSYLRKAGPYRARRGAGTSIPDRILLNRLFGLFCHGPFYMMKAGPYRARRGADTSISGAYFSEQKVVFSNQMLFYIRGRLGRIALAAGQEPQCSGRMFRKTRISTTYSTVPTLGTARRDPPRHVDVIIQILVKIWLM